MTVEMLMLVGAAIYFVGAFYLFFFVAIPSLASADCDHAFLLILPVALVAVAFWPIALLWLAWVNFVGRRQQ